MSEIKKNIETCRGEDVLAEVSAMPQDPHFGSLVNEALDPLKQQAQHQAGYDGYSEVIEQHKPYTFASAIIQMKSNLLLFLRALWQFPFGSGTLRSLSDDTSLRSLADMWQHYITRLSGNETYGIPSRLSSLTALPSAPLLLADRKISGVPEAEDGISLVHLLCDSTVPLTELTDDNQYACDRSFDCNDSRFANVEKLTIGCTENSTYVFTMRGYSAQMDSLKELNFPNMVIGRTLINNTGVSGWFHPGFVNLETITFPVMQEIKQPSYVPGSYAYAFISRTLPKLKKIQFPVLVTLGDYLFGGAAFTALEEMRMPELRYANRPFFNTYREGDGCPNLILLEVGAVQTNLNISFWNPTNVLADADKTAIFLSNFRTYIALRLADNGSGKTLTLSQAVYDAIKDESHLFVFDEGTMTIYAYLTNIKHWTVTK